MASYSYSIGASFTNAQGNVLMITGSHRAGQYRGAKTIWEGTIDGQPIEMDSEQLKRKFWNEKRVYTGQTSGQRVATSAEAIEKKAEGEVQKLTSAVKTLAEFGYSVEIDEDAFKAARIKHWKKEAVRIEAERKAKAEATKAEREAKKASLKALSELSPEQLAALVASLNK